MQELILTLSGKFRDTVCRCFFQKGRRDAIWLVRYLDFRRVSAVSGLTQGAGLS